jgi:hypothetical protein
VEAAGFEFGGPGLLAFAMGAFQAGAADEGALVFGADAMTAILVDYLENHQVREQGDRTHRGYDCGRWLGEMERQAK